MMYAAQDIVIDQMRIRASKRDAQLIANDLEHGSWSVQSAYEWVFVRGIPVTASKNAMRQSVSQAVNQTLAGAVDGRLSGAEHAAAVYFSSLPQLLAFLLRDLVRRDAVRKWYWKRWDYLLSGHKSQAVNHLLWEYVEYLPAVIEELVVISFLAEVWQELSEDAATQITEKLIRPSNSYAAAEGTLQGSDDSGTLKSINLAIHGFYQQRAGLSPWVSLLSPLKSHDRRYQLAAVIAALRYCPLVLEQNVSAAIQGFSSVIERLKQDDTSRPLQSRHDMKGDGDFISLLVTHGVTDQTGSENADEKSLAATVDVGGQISRDEKSAVADKTTIINPDARGLSDTNTLADYRLDEADFHPGFGKALKQRSSPERTVPEEEVDVDSALNAEERFDTAETAISGNSFQTTSGGLFYLINALNSKVGQDLLHRTEPGEHVHGWVWLFDLARRLGAGLDLDILRFIADQCGYENSEALLEIPPLPEMEEVEAALASRYQKQDFWNPSLIEVPARVVATASHIDVFYALNTVRLSVRLAGLDVNPGWVPWLGRVVQLHYVSGPA